MNAHSRFRDRAARALSTALLLAAMGAPAAAVPTFISTDPRLPNPDQPYISEGRFDNGFVYLQDFHMTATNPSQLDIPEPVPGGYEFASMYDVAFTTILGIGLAPPVHVSGTGTVLATGFAPEGSEPNFVFDTEIVAMHLMSTTPGFTNVSMRESATLESNGVTTVEGGCYGVCPAIVLEMRISSFFDVFTEISLDGGLTWTPSIGSTRIVQTPEPAAAWLALSGAGAFALSRWRRGRA